MTGFQERLYLATSMVANLIGLLQATRSSCQVRIWPEQLQSFGSDHLSPAPLTFLSSRKHNLISIYDVSRGDDDGLIHVGGVPYCLPHIQSNQAGVVFFQHPLDQRETNVSLFCCSDRGSIRQLDLESIPYNEVALPLRDPAYEWSEDVEELDGRASGLRPDIGPLGAREFTTVNMKSLYDGKLAASS
jgi:hypothetical protein